jgi:hypothetical protein
VVVSVVGVIDSRSLVVVVVGGVRRPAILFPVATASAGRRLWSLMGYGTYGSPVMRSKGPQCLGPTGPQWIDPKPTRSPVQSALKNNSHQPRRRQACNRFPNVPNRSARPLGDVFL